ncbi:MAG: hypothetical protein V1743_02765 [Nanoarchaeota archaeon]
MIIMKYLIALLVMAVLAAACTNTPNTERTADNSQQTAPGSPDTSDQSAATETPENTPAENEAGTGTGDTPAKLKDIFSRKAEFVVTYTVRAAGTESEMTQYVADAKMRTDVATQGIEARTFLIGNEYTSCNKAGEEWMCQKIAYTPSTNTADDVKENIDQYTVENLPGRTIAGAATDCFKVSMTDGTAEYCYSKEFVPLYIKTTAGTTVSEMEAKTYSTSIPADAFTFPAEPGEPIDMSQYVPS